MYPFQQGGGIAGIQPHMAAPMVGQGLAAGLAGGVSMVPQPGVFPPQPQRYDPREMARMLLSMGGGFRY